MTDFRHHLRHPWFALAAIVGMLSVVGEASACSATSASLAARACCTGRVGSACCCEPAKSASQSDSSDRTTVSSHAAGRLASEPLCECRPGGPTEPASKPVSPAPDRRTAQDRSGSVEPTFDVRTAVALARPIPQTGSPPETPLYLRTSRLLI